MFRGNPPKNQYSYGSSLQRSEPDYHTKWARWEATTCIWHSSNYKRKFCLQKERNKFYRLSLQQFPLCTETKVSERLPYLIIYGLHFSCHFSIPENKGLTIMRKIPKAYKLQDIIRLIFSAMLIRVWSIHSFSSAQTWIQDGNFIFFGNNFHLKITNGRKLQPLTVIIRTTTDHSFSFPIILTRTPEASVSDRNASCHVKKHRCF